MRTYHRCFIPGATYFFTVVVANRRRTDVLVRNVDALRESFRCVRSSHPFNLVAIVVLPDHLHCLWELPDGDCDFALRWRQIKSEFSRRLPKTEAISCSRRAKRERGIWQRRYWEHAIRDEEDFHRHLDYIHYHPVKHGHATRAIDWPYSSFKRWVDLGYYGPGWGISDCVDDLPYDD